MFNVAELMGIASCLESYRQFLALTGQNEQANSVHKLIVRVKQELDETEN